MPSLETLAPEMVDALCSYLDSPSLNAMARSCKHLSEFALRALYKNIVLNDMPRDNLPEILREKPELASSVQSLTFEFGQWYGDYHADNILPWLPNLRKLSLFTHAGNPESEILEASHFDYVVGVGDSVVGLGLRWPGPEERFRDPSIVRAAASHIGSWLPKLETCHLQFADMAGPAWSLVQKSVIFLHPTLRSLDIYQASHEADLDDPYPNLDAIREREEAWIADEDDVWDDEFSNYWRSAIFDVDTGPRSTNLMTLRFHLSDIDPGALSKILSFPRALEDFTLTQIYASEYGPRFGPEPVVEALRQQRHSLASLVLTGIEASTSAGILLGMFDQLRTLEIDFDMLFGGDCHHTKLPDITSHLPSRLESLTLRYRVSNDSRRKDLRRVRFLAHLVAAQVASLPNLVKICLVEQKLAQDSLGPEITILNEIRDRLESLREKSVSNQVEIVYEAKLLPWNPYPDRLRKSLKTIGGNEGHDHPPKESARQCYYI